MSKKINENAVMTATLSLKDYFEKFPNASIRKLSVATNINYGILLKKSKEPIPGAAYDPESTNWEALEAKLIAKGVDWTQLDWDELNTERQRKGGTLCKDIDAYSVGTEVYLRKNNTTPYVVVYKTETHIVVMLKGTSEPQSLSHSTFMLYGPSLQPRAKKEEA